MRPLPAIVAGSARVILPMADSSADALIDAFLATGDCDRKALESVLALDPPLLLWTAHHAAEELHENSPTVAALTDWLLERGPAVLDSSEAESVEIEPHLWAERVVRAVHIGEMSRREATHGQAEQAYLAGVLSVAGQWSPQVSLPSLVETTFTEDSPAADEAARAAADAGKRWLESTQLSERLPALVKKLARLDRLEGQFDQILLAEKLESMAEFAAGAGHEINNPVAVIAGRAQLFLQSETDPERRRALALMNAQAKRVYEMITDMMLFARPPAAEHKTVELISIVDRVVEELKAAAGEQAVSISRIGLDGPLEIEADPEQLNVALRALCRNSLEAIGHDGNIEIEVQLDGMPSSSTGKSCNCAIIRVEDDGPGIPDDVLRHIFDPFYSARQAGRGLGLGLSKCWRIVVTNHGGRIDVDSAPGRPTVFTIALPVSPSTHE